MDKSLSLSVALATALLSSTAFGNAAQPAAAPAPAVKAAAPAEPDAIAIYGDNSPGSAADENWTRFMGRELVVRNITHPTLIPVLPDPENATGAAVIVAPGGAFHMLAMENEGWRVAHALADRGVAAFVLKYRLLPTPPDEAGFIAKMSQLMAGAMSGKGTPPTIEDPAATEDTLAALALVRARSGPWGIDPHRVGIIGFSAGAMTALNAVLAAKPGQGPDLLGYIYGPMAAVNVPADAPPMFAALAMDDPLFGNGEFGIVTAWQHAHRQVELHAYQKGSHGFGLGAPGTTTTLVFDEFAAWLTLHGFLKPKAPK